MIVTEEQMLMHYGVKGMRWGVRKSRPTSSGGFGRKKSSSGIAKLKKRAALRKAYKSKKAATAKAKTTRSIKDMSDDELRQRINRIQLEKTYAQLTAKQKSAGRKFVEGVLSQSAKNVATKYTTDYATKLIDGLIKKKK